MGYALKIVILSVSSPQAISISLTAPLNEEGPETTTRQRPPTPANVRACSGANSLASSSRVTRDSQTRTLGSARSPSKLAPAASGNGVGSPLLFRADGEIASTHRSSLACPGAAPHHLVSSLAMRTSSARHANTRLTGEFRGGLLHPVALVPKHVAGSVWCSTCR